MLLFHTTFIIKLFIFVSHMPDARIYSDHNETLTDVMAVSPIDLLF